MTYGNGGDLSDMSMMELFRMEAENQCNQLSEDLLALEQEPTASDLLESLMRASHSVKGAARVVELHPAVKVAHAMEDVFVAAQDGKISLDQDAIDLMLKGVDMLNSISQVADEETELFFQEKSAEIDSLVNSFTALAKGEKTASAPPAAAPSTPEAAPQAPAVENVESTQLPIDMSDMSMLDLFRMEAETHCTKLSEDLVSLESNPTSSELLESMMRAAHSMKGAARIVELHAAVKLAHAMEDVFVAVQKEKIIIDKNDIDLLLDSVDLLTAIAEVPESDADKWFADHNSAIDALVKKLAGLPKGEKTAADSAAPVAAKEKKEPEPLKTPGPLPPEKEPAPEKSIDSAAKRKETKKQARRSDDKDGLRAVRVSAQSMDRMMGLAGESLIESRWLPTFNKELLRLKYRQDALYVTIDKIRENLNSTKADEMTISLFGDLQHKLEICRSILIQDMEVLEDHARHATNISHRLYKEIITSKMRPFSEGIRGFARMVRDIAKELGKEINFEVIGPDTMLTVIFLIRLKHPLTT